jgi:flagellar biosynthesis/type III secretory pathway protein FliH
MSSDRVNPQEPKAMTETFHYLSTSDDGPAAATKIGDPLEWQKRMSFSAAKSEQQEKETFDRGIVEGRNRGKAEFDKQIEASRAMVANTVQTFKTQRENYFNRVETEIVQLSLAIARKILHREVQMDPLLLAGLVHVTLEKLESGTSVRLRANPADIHYWSEYFSQSASFQPAPELIGDDSLKPGECALEGDMGTTQISIETQLKEIEQGFFDLLEQRPRIT